LLCFRGAEAFTRMCKLCNAIDDWTVGLIIGNATVVDVLTASVLSYMYREFARAPS